MRLDKLPIKVGKKYDLGKKIEFVKKIRCTINVYFVVLSLLLLVSLYFTLKGSTWSIWSIIPAKYQYLISNGDLTLYNIGLAYICSYIFYLFVSYLPDRKRVKDETYSFLFEVQQYMFVMGQAITFEKKIPEIFLKKLYKKPIEPLKLYKKNKLWNKYINVFHNCYNEIEFYYTGYISYANQKDLSKPDQDYVQKCKEKLEVCSNEYQECANQMTEIFFEKVM